MRINDSRLDIFSRQSWLRSFVLRVGFAALVADAVTEIPLFAFFKVSHLLPSEFTHGFGSGGNPFVGLALGWSVPLLLGAPIVLVPKRLCPESLPVKSVFYMLLTFTAIFIAVLYVVPFVGNTL